MLTDRDILENLGYPSYVAGRVGTQIAPTYQGCAETSKALAAAAAGADTLRRAG